MSQVKFYVTLEIDEDCLSDECYEDTMDFISSGIHNIANSLQGDVIDVEIK